MEMQGIPEEEVQVKAVDVLGKVSIEEGKY